jgi:hypothetical protein
MNCRGMIMSLRTAFLSTATLVAISFWGLAVYSDGALAGKAPVDGYGISAAFTSSVN